MSDPIKLVTTKSDFEVAEELKKELVEAAKPYLAAASKAAALGFIMQSQFGPSAFSKEIIITDLKIIKIF